MLIESITLKNFRQFRDESITFAQGDDGKNVTIIMGENGSGKTTFAQAFSWCMYGETDFADKDMLNKIAAEELTPGGKAKVEVRLCLRHGDVSYTLAREQTYTKNFDNKLKRDNAIFNIARKGADGNTTFVKPLHCESVVASILPKELSKYFFFDGERIERMSKDIYEGKKSDDFAEAVKGLLGLNAINKAIEHFNPRSKHGVIAGFAAAFDAGSNSKIKEYTSAIESCNDEIAQIDERLEELKGQEEKAEERKKEKEEEIKLYEDGARLQRQKEELQEKIDEETQARADTVKAICRDFNSNSGMGMSAFFSRSLMHRALILLKSKDFTGKDIPSIDAKTIEYLLNRKECICGACLDEGAEAYNKVKELFEFLPPKSISSSISDFKNEARNRARQQELLAEIREKLGIISDQDETIAELKDDLGKIEKKLDGDKVEAKVRAINADIKLCAKTIRESREERDDLLQKRGGLDAKLSRANSELSKLALLDKKNKKIETYKKYAELIYDDLLEVYSTSEAKIRRRLEDTINEIFKTIYEGGLYLTIDEKYRIWMYANAYKGKKVEGSTGQSASAVLAFIAAIIKMAKENQNSTDENAKLLSSEPYPLVMDAPLSTFDKERIKTVCEVLPGIAEQVIIFIKDADGEIAEKHMADKIGRRASFKKNSEFETVLA